MDINAAGRGSSTATQQHSVSIMVQPLALDVAPAGQAPGWRKHEDIIDALPYVDTLSEAEKARVDALIREEVCA